MLRRNGAIFRRNRRNVAIFILLAFCISTYTWNMFYLEKRSAHENHILNQPPLNNHLGIPLNTWLTSNQTPLINHRDKPAHSWLTNQTSNQAPPVNHQDKTLTSWPSNQAPPVNHQDKTLTSWPNKRDTQRVEVLLYTCYRCGSTFFGEFFNRNPEFSFMFEPLRCLPGEFSLPETLVQTLREQFECTLAQALSRTRQAAQLWNHKPLCGQEYRKIYERARAHLGHTDKVSVSRLEPSTNTSSQYHHNEQNISMSQLESACKSFPHAAIKIIRGQQVPYVWDFLLPRDISTRRLMFYLARDPRGSAVSRYIIHFNDKHMTHINMKHNREWVGRNSERTCERYRQDLKFLIDATTMDFRGTVFRLVRYEDVAFWPKRMAELLYDVVGLPLPDDVLRWIDNSTRAETEDGTYGTTRNSKKTAEAWRSALPLDLAQAVDDICADVLDILGYLRADPMTYDNSSISYVGNTSLHYRLI